jgi:beta-galactosidase
MPLAMILSGEIHYPRVPRALWRDRLLKLKRAGFNTVTMYFFWNYHEVEPGKFDFSGEKDVDEFISIANSLGLKFIARVGPYDCAEWDNGGHPDWLISDSLIGRSLDKSYFPYAERWLRVILSRLSKYDQGRGGNMVALQLENEYFWGDIPLHIELAKIARQLGITVDLYTNANRFARNTYFIDSVDLYPESWRLDQVVWALKDLQATQPMTRVKIMEYEGGWFSKVTKPLPTERGSFPANWTRMLLATALAHGADLISFYMFHGGTNFGYWTGRWITTTYDYEAMVREWGEIHERYYKVRTLSQVAQIVEGSELESEDNEGGRMRVIRVKDGTRFTFRINNTDSEWIDSGVRVPARDVRVTVEDLNVGSLVVSSNLDLLASVGETVIFYGDKGEPFLVNLSQGRVISCHDATPTPSGFSGSVGEVAGCLVETREGTKRVLVVERSLAERTWFLDYPVISNAYFVEDGDLRGLKAHLLDGKAVFYLPMRVGKYIPELELGRVEVEVHTPPTEFQVVSVGWKPLRVKKLGTFESPPPLEDAGIFKHGIYSYTAEVRKGGKFGFAVNDIGVVFNDDQVKAGVVWVEGEVKEGKVRVLVDSTGHPNDPEWSMVPFKTGLVSPILLDPLEEESLTSWEYGVIDLGERYQPGLATFNSHSYLLNRDIPAKVQQVKEWTRELPKLNSPLVVLYARARFQSKGRSPCTITIEGLRGPIVVMLNGSVIYKGRGNDVFNTVIYGELKEGENEVVIGTPLYNVRGETRSPFREVKMCEWRGIVKGYELGEVVEVEEGGGVAGLPFELREPSVLRIEFKVKRGSEIAPSYVRLQGKFVGQVILNGRMIGRYYDFGSQDKFYLPEPYLNEGVNELKVVAVPTSVGSQVIVDFGTYYSAREAHVSF